MRINKYLSQSGLGSRRKVEELIHDGLVSVNGEIIQDLSIKISDQDQVKCRGKLLKPRTNYITIAFNKPKGCLCSKDDPLGRPLIYDFLPFKYHHLNYVGRLDYNSRGLLLLTSDGELLKNLNSPKNQVPKVYRVKIHKPMKEAHVKTLEKGMYLNGFRYHPIRVKTEGTTVYLTLSEGKNREIRKIMEALFYQVYDLKRVAIAHLKLSRLEISEREFVLVNWFEEESTF